MLLFSLCYCYFLLCDASCGVSLSANTLLVVGDYKSICCRVPVYFVIIPVN
uniref:Uncharacterized protein n=1 Tax=Rhizophora mucronata TaxID=61149 RepID=A0A2P2IUS8_RHIMU